MWIYSSSDGMLAHGAVMVTTAGWSGHDAGRNNPQMEMEPDIGPIPRGMWDIGEAEEHAKLGPVAMPLTPINGTETFGRTGFFIHGAAALNPGESSHGCVILPHDVREQIAASDDKILMVV